MSKVRRIFDIAKELNISHIEIIDFLKKEDSGKYTIMSSIPNELYGKILEQFYQDVSAVDRLRKEMARFNVVHPNQDSNEVSEVNNEDEKLKDDNIKEDQKDNKIEKIQESNDEVEEKNVEKVPESKKKEDIKRPNIAKVDIKAHDNKVSINIERPKRKLKKIDISSIADRINTTKKKQEAGSVKTSVSQLSKKASKRKKSKKEEEIILDDENMQKAQPLQSPLSNPSEIYEQRNWLIHRHSVCTILCVLFCKLRNYT